MAGVDLESVAAALAPRLVAYGLGRTGCPSTAEDIAQDALTALVRRWRTMGPPESPEAYLFAIAKRRAGRAPLDVLRGNARDAPSVEQAYASRTELAVVWSRLRALPAKDREALLLRLAGELTIEQIAAVMHTTPAAAKMRISRARRRLATLLSERSDGR